MQMLKFGQVINLEAIESVSVDKGARTLNPNPNPNPNPNLP